MAENENNLFGGEFDLGSSFGDFTLGEGPNPFDDEFKDGEANKEVTEPEKTEVDSVEKSEAQSDEIKESEKKMEAKNNEEQTTVISQADSVGEKTAAEEVKNETKEQGLFDAIISEAEGKQADTTKGNLAEKLPVFTYAKAEEEIADTSKTFDKLRYEKSDDFPELDDGSSVSWKVTYAGVVVNVTEPKKATIASVKKKIEESKDFLDKLKKMKTEKERSEVVCKITPSVAAKKKGTVENAYKGIYKSVEDAVASQKAIAYVPSEDGVIYQVRSNKVGTFIAPAKKVSILGKVRAGFNSALPKIPNKILTEVISFFRAFVNDKHEYEAMCLICWDIEKEEYFVFVPKQAVSKSSIAAIMPELDEEKVVLVMEIHSHNTMSAFFSQIDNDDEKATGLYCVIGKITQYFPSILVRASVGGVFVDLLPEDVFEGIYEAYPDEWSNSVNNNKSLEDGGADDEVRNIQTC